MINHIETEKKIVRFVVAVTGILEVEIKSPIRNKHMVRARSIYAHIMRLAEFSYPEIGSYLNRDHTTVMHLIKHYEKHRYEDEIGVKIRDAFPELSPESTAPIIISS